MRWRLRRALVTGPSMAPALRDGDQIVVWLGRARSLRPGDVVVVELPAAPYAVKRVVTIQPDGAVWIEGDNPFGSTDSRHLGAVAAENVRGRVVGRLWPHPGRVRRQARPGHGASSH